MPWRGHLRPLEATRGPLGPAARRPRFDSDMYRGDWLVGQPDFLTRGRYRADIGTLNCKHSCWHAKTPHSQHTLSCPEWVLRAGSVCPHAESEHYRANCPESAERAMMRSHVIEVRLFQRCSSWCQYNVYEMYTKAPCIIPVVCLFLMLKHRPIATIGQIVCFYAYMTCITLFLHANSANYGKSSTNTEIFLAIYLNYNVIFRSSGISAFQRYQVCKNRSRNDWVKGLRPIKYYCQELRSILPCR